MHWHRCRAALVAAAAVILAIGMLPSAAAALPLAPPPKQSCTPQVQLTPPQILSEGPLKLATQDNYLTNYGLGSLGPRIDTIAALGVRVVRYDVLWSKIQRNAPVYNGADPKDPSYNWKRLDRVMRGFGYCGISVILNVYRAPAWANGHPYLADPTADVAERAYMPDLTAYGNFITALATRYSGHYRVRLHGTSRLVFPRAAFIEAWNEGNMSSFLMPQWQQDAGGKWQAVSPANYAALLSTAYSRMHAAQASSRWPPVVIGVSGGSGGSLCAPGAVMSPKTNTCRKAASGEALNPGVALEAFIGQLAVLKPPMDAYSVHLYTKLGPNQPTPAFPSYSTLGSRVIPMLDTIQPGLPVLVTEFGWTTSASPVRAAGAVVSESQQADYFNQAMNIFAANPRVRVASYFDVEDNPVWASGLRRIGGQPKPIESQFVKAATQFR